MHTKILIRTDSFFEHYQQWLQRDVKDVLEMLSGSYANELFGNGAIDLHYQQTPTCKQILWEPECLPHQSIGYLIDYFKTNLVAFAGYQNCISDERTEVYDKGMRMTIHRHLLKHIACNLPIPTALFDNPKGNLHLEHRFNKNQNVLFIKSIDCNNPQFNSFENMMSFLLKF